MKKLLWILFYMQIMCHFKIEQQGLHTKLYFRFLSLMLQIVTTY